MFRQILVPIDGSAASMHALDVAIELAESASASLVLMTVVDALPAWVAPPPPEGAAAAEQSLGAFRRKREALMRDALALVPESTPVRKVVTGGHPAEKILKQLAEGDYDLVVIGSRGLHGIGAALLGSVSRQVLARSEVPVLVVRADAGRADWQPAEES
jgi:nucleotide-binding universal stress UspA family protein